MGVVVVGIAECRVSANCEDELVTYALGSCIGVVLYDPLAKVGGLLHVLLPESNLDPNKAKANPFVFADSGVPLLLERVESLGARKSRLATQIVGGAQINANSAIWSIGKKNAFAARQALQLFGLRVQNELVGGTKARTVRLQISTGKVEIIEIESGRMAACRPQGSS